VKRREFIMLLGGAAAWPIVARAQQSERIRRIGWLDGTNGSDPETITRIAVFRSELRALGWVEGQTIEIIFRFAAIDPDQNRAHVAEFTAMSPDVIVATSPASISSLLEKTRRIPIVFPLMTDPVALGFAHNLARPGGRYRLHSFRRGHRFKMAGITAGGCSWRKTGRGSLRAGFAQYVSPDGVIR
jgi:putative ABC transport system substrate-binding protein